MEGAGKLSLNRVSHRAQHGAQANTGGDLISPAAQSAFPLDRGTSFL